MSDSTSLPEEGLDRWLADQHHALVDDLVAALDLEAGLREAMIPARHAGLVADLRDVLDVEAGLSAIVSATPDVPLGDDPDSWRIDESPSPPGSVAVAVRRGTSARVFVSHARDDRTLAEELYRQLVEDGHEVLLEQHVSDDIAVGGEWARRLHQRLQWADAMVCVLTSAYLASRWCTTEVAFARSRGDLLLPVRAEPGVDDPLLRSVTDTDLAPDSVAAALVRTLRRIDDTGVLGWPKDRSPFPGLRPFDTDQHRVFFGRTDDVKQLATLLRSSDERAEGAALLVVGPSGCGKSSLVRAGLLPMMASEPGWWTLSSIVPGADPVMALARELAAEAQRIGLNWSVEHVRRQLDDRGLGELADELLLVAPGGPHRHLLVVVDQFEELLTQTGPTHRARFAELLSSALTGAVRMVGTLRPEFLNQLLADPELVGLSTEIYPLRPLRGEALRAIIEGPARLAGIGVDEHLVARLIDDAGSAEALPLLAFTLAQLAEGVSRGGQLSPARYDQLGGLQGALTRHADTALADAVLASGLTEREVLAGLTRLVTVDETGRRARRRMELIGVTEPLRVALQVFVDRRLLLSDVDKDGHGWLTVTHEALITGWQPLNVATTDIIDALRTAQAVEQAAAEWNSAGRPEHYLWDGERLTATLTTLGMSGEVGSRNPAAPAIVEIDDEAVAFLDATSWRVRAAQRRERRRRTRTIAGLVALLVFALVAAGVAVWQRQNAISAQRIAIARQLVAQAEVARNTDSRIALRLSVAAAHIHSDGETRSSLINLLANSGYSSTLAGHTGPVNSVAFSPDGRILATASADQTVRLWDLTDPLHPASVVTLVGLAGPVNSVAFSPDGRILATANADKTFTLWNLTDLHHPTTIFSFDYLEPVNSVAFSPSGHILATASADGTVRLWDLIDLRHPAPVDTFIGHMGPVNSVAFSPSGHILATAGADGTVRLWDVTDPHHSYSVATLTGHTGPVYGVAFSPDGHTLATPGADQIVRLWNFGDPRHPALVATLAGYTGPVYGVAFSPDGHTLATPGAGRTVLLWDLTDPTRPRRLGQALTGQNGVVRSVAFVLNGHILATGSDDATTILWNLSSVNDLRGNAAERACSIAGGGLNRDQWVHYIPGLPYEQTCPSN